MRIQQIVNRKIAGNQNLKNAKLRQVQNLETRRASAMHGLVRWDEYRTRKAEITELYIKMKQDLAMKRVWMFMTLFFALI